MRPSLVCVGTDDADLAKPIFGAVGPTVDHRARVAQPVAVAAAVVEEEPGAHAGRLQGAIVGEAAVDERFVVFGLHDHRRGGALRDVQLGRRPAAVAGARPEVRGVDEEAEVGSAGGFVDGLQRVGAAVEPGSGQRGQVSAGRESEHADAVRIDVERCAMGTHVADGALEVLQRSLVGRPTLTLGHAILEQHGRDAQVVEPEAGLVALQVVGQEVVSAARADDDGRSGGKLLRGLIDGDRRLVDVRDAQHIFAGHAVALRILLFDQCVGAAGHAFGKELDGFVLRRGRLHIAHADA